MVLAFAACDAGAQKDAAERVREGDVDQWVEYYRQQRATGAPAKEKPAADRPAPQPADATPPPRK
jgi:hypothetical protein